MAKEQRQAKTLTCVLGSNQRRFDRAPRASIQHRRWLMSCDPSSTGGYVVPLMKLCLALVCLSLIATLSAWGDEPSPRSLSVTLVPPSPVSNQINLDIRAAVHNQRSQSIVCNVSFYLDSASPDHLLYHKKITVPPHGATGTAFHWPTQHHAGHHRLIVRVTSSNLNLTASKQLHIIPSTSRSVGTIQGAWIEFYHWSNREGAPWNKQLKSMTPSQWRQLIKSMHHIGINIAVIQQEFLNNRYVGRKNAPEITGVYHGRAYYPSKLYPGRMPIATKDPTEVVLNEADKLCGLAILSGGCQRVGHGFKNIADSLRRPGVG